MSPAPRPRPGIVEILGVGPGPGSARAQSKSVAFACRRASRATLLSHMPARCRSVPVTSSLTCPARRTSRPTSATRVSTCSVFVPVTAWWAAALVRISRAATVTCSARRLSLDASTVAQAPRLSLGGCFPVGPHEDRGDVRRGARARPRHHGVAASGHEQAGGGEHGRGPAPERPAAPRPRLDHGLAKLGLAYLSRRRAILLVQKTREHRAARRLGGFGRLSRLGRGGRLRAAITRHGQALPRRTPARARPATRWCPGSP